MSTYYKIIDGINYDNNLIEETNNLIKGQGDGRISVEDSEKLLIKILDKNKITQVEHRTIYYILNNYNFTEEGLKNILSKLQKK
jgi:hypothetical protein|tara:strand:- start:555 stop:806 length:252 start_codon:yes stop_codon:yes gene_type:complete